MATPNEFILTDLDGDVLRFRLGPEPAVNYGPLAPKPYVDLLCDGLVLRSYNPRALLADLEHLMDWLDAKIQEAKADATPQG